MLPSFLLLRPRPNGSKFNALHSNIVNVMLRKCLLITQTRKPVWKKSLEVHGCCFHPSRVHSMICGILNQRFPSIYWYNANRLQVWCFDMVHTYKYSFINLFSSRQLKVLVHRTSMNRIIVITIGLWQLAGFSLKANSWWDLPPIYIYFT